jgi:hypothetical protein
VAGSTFQRFCDQLATQCLFVTNRERPLAGGLEIVLALRERREHFAAQTRDETGVNSHWARVTGRLHRNVSPGALPFVAPFVAALEGPLRQVRILPMRRGTPARPTVDAVFAIL